MLDDPMEISLAATFLSGTAVAQKRLVSSSLSEFRNYILTIPGMSEGDKVDRICNGLKPDLRLEVIKSVFQCLMSFKDCIER